MANYVKIALLSGSRPKLLGEYRGAEHAFSLIKEYWDERIGIASEDRPNIILLPEMSTSFDDFKKEDEDDYYSQAIPLFHEYFKAASKKADTVLMYSTIREDDEGFRRNSTVTISPQGHILGVYDKVHPTSWEVQDSRIIPGKESICRDIGLLKAGFAICFDLNFDELRLSYKEKKPDAIFFSSVFHGGLMQNYWAYSTRSFFAGCIHGMESQLINPVGQVITKTTNYTSHVCGTINTDSKVMHLDFNINKLDDIKRKYKTGVSISDPGYLGSILLNSEMEDVTSDDIVREFELMLLDDYFDWARNIQASGRK
jgi:predicted amidohydrolase